METQDRPSKSQRKRDMDPLQKTGAQLVELNAGQLAEIALPERLLDAILAAKRIRDFEGRRRQMQYIGKLMRDVDPGPIRASLDRWSGSSHQQTAQLHAVERWRDRLMSDDDALTVFVAEHPHADVQRLRKLIASVKRDNAANQPPRNSRELFRQLREIMGKPASQKEAEDTE